MIKNYLVVAIRNLMKQKLYSSVTIFGLALGMACFFLVSSFLEFEKSYDSFHKNAASVYRVDGIINSKNGSYQRALTCGPLAPRLAATFPSIKNAVRFAPSFASLISVTDKTFKENRFFFADGSFFNLFSFNLLKGNPQTALDQAFTVVITPAMAQKYFGSENPIGKTIYFQNKYTFIVTGIIEEAPANSSIKFDFIASFSSLNTIWGQKRVDESWESPVWTFIQLHEKAERGELEKQFPQFVSSNVPKSDFNPVNLCLVPLKEMYYTKTDGVSIGDFGFKPLTYILYFISLLVLLVACVNFMNMLFARSTTRAKEIGIRKVQGAKRSQLVFQFMAESVVTSLISLLLAVLLVEMLLPYFTSIIQDCFPTFGVLPARKISFGILDSSFSIYMAVVSVAVGIISGLYPAIFLSRLDPAFVIKGELRSGKTSAILRKALVVFQFCIAITFINCTVILLQQIHHMKNSDLGFDKENIVNLPVYTRDLKQKYETIKSALLQNPNIEEVTCSNIVPGVSDTHVVNVKSEGKNEDRAVFFQVDYGFLKTMGLKLKDGRDFSKSIQSDSTSSIIINETAMKQFGWHSASGQNIETYWKENDKITNYSSGNLIGIVKNFKYRLIDESNSPVVIKISPRYAEFILIKINGAAAQEAVAHIRKTLSSFDVNQAFDYSFIDDEIDRLFSFASAFSSLIGVSSFFEFLIASAGLLALAAFIIERKTKEVGVRKVLGAKSRQVIYLLSKDFVILVITAVSLAAPFSFWICDKAAQGMQDHAEVSPLTFIVTSVIVIGLSIAVVGIKSFTAASANPADSLRYE
jgi:putative ABC transport system permease protein